MNRESRLDVLTNNAGALTPPLGSRTSQGHELQVGTNAPGHYLFTVLVSSIHQKTAAMSASNSVRITWPSSLATFMAPENAMHWDTSTDAFRMTAVGVSQVIYMTLSPEGPKNRKGSV